MKEFAARLLLLKTNNTYIQFFRYAFVGGFSTLVDMSGFYFSQTLLGMNYLLAQTIGFILGIATNYLISIAWVFKSTGNLKKEIILFTVIGIGGLILSYFFLWILIDLLNLTQFNNMLAKVITVVIVLFWNFSMRKKFVF